MTATVFAAVMAAIVPAIAAEIDELRATAREGLDEALTWLTAGPIGLSERDIVIEHRDGSATAVEVKSAATVHRRDLRGLTHLRDMLGPRFKAGALLYTGANTMPFGDRLGRRADERSVVRRLGIAVRGGGRHTFRLRVAQLQADVREGLRSAG